MSQAITFFPQTPVRITTPLATLSHQGAARKPTFALYTLGCKVNQYDSHQIARTLVSRGFRRVEFRESADLYVIDTCTVTAEADKKSRKAAGRAHRNNAEAVVAVTGCAAARDAEQFRRVAPDALVLDNSRKWELPDLALEALNTRAAWAENYAQVREQTGSEPMPSATRERAVLKIQDGCNHKCAYCIIPSVRGVSVVKSRAAAMAEARSFVREGARELTITGVSMSDWKENAGYGALGAGPGAAPDADTGSTVDFRVPAAGRADTLRRTTSKNAALNDLLRAVASIEGLERVRVSSLDPADVDDAWLETLARTPKICPHIHLALQSGSASTLRRMRRRYTPEMYLRAARRWREIRPDGALTTDIIVGFPGETEEEWEETMALARAANFSAIHVFPYSPRAGTAAAEFRDFVAPEIQNRRVDELLALAKELSANYAARFFGMPQEVFVENVKDNIADGLTPHYVRARVKLDKLAAPGDIISFVPQSWNGEALE